MDLCSRLPKTTAAQVIGRQLFRSGTSVGAQYREGVRARSDAEYASKVQGAPQELEESMYWMELLDESGTLKADATRGLKSEADELAAILVTCSNKAGKKAGKR
jgi:four helix bundle protein